MSEANKEDMSDRGRASAGVHYLPQKILEMNNEILRMQDQISNVADAFDQLVGNQVKDLDMAKKQALKKLAKKIFNNITLKTLEDFMHTFLQFRTVVTVVDLGLDDQTEQALKRNIIRAA